MGMFASIVLGDLGAFLRENLLFEERFYCFQDRLFGMRLLEWSFVFYCYPEGQRNLFGLLVCYVGYSMLFDGAFERLSLVGWLVGLFGCFYCH